MRSLCFAQIQSSQVSRIEHESRSFQCNLTLSHRHKHFSRIGTIDHFTVVCLVAWPLNESEARVDLVLIETSLLSQSFKLSDVLMNSKFFPSLALNFSQCSICSSAINFLVSCVNSG